MNSDSDNEDKDYLAVSKRGNLKKVFKNNWFYYWIFIDYLFRLILNKHGHGVKCNNNFLIRF